ncbi:MAG: serine/threonine protein phosphatase PrpC [Acidimicrobiales bacterium]|jgi:PPM family protein phosphatase
MRVVGAMATHVGQVRDANQDRALVSGSLGAVADGMGGHLGGEHAAALAVAELSGVRGQISEQRLVEVVEAANQRIFEGATEPQYRGMGTTIVAATFSDDTHVMSIVNVGDSRAYLYRNDDLKQITVDHSLVEDLLRQGRLTAEEARTHPQRNIVTRALGIGPEVQVDTFSVQMQAGDRMILASDGLFNEVEDAGIAAILARLANPDEAVEELVSTAVEHGGRDNVTVVVLDTVSDSGESDAGAVADGEEARAQSAVDDELVGAVARPRKRRRIGFRSAMLVVGVVGVMAFAFGGTAFYARSGFFAEGRDGAVVIYRGRPGGVMWFKPSQVEITSRQVDDLDGASIERLDRQTVWPSLEDAKQFVENLEDAEVGAPGPSTGSTLTPESMSTTETVPPTGPITTLTSTTTSDS